MTEEKKDITEEILKLNEKMAKDVEQTAKHINEERRDKLGGFIVRQQSKKDYESGLSETQIRIRIDKNIKNGSNSECA